MREKMMAVTKYRRMADLNAAVKQLEREGQGVWQLSLYQRESLVETMVSAMCGDTHAARALDVVAQTLRKISAHGRRHDAQQCLLCEARFWKRELPDTIGILSPRLDDPARSIVFGICSGCVTQHDRSSWHALQHAVQDKLRATVFADLRVLPLHPEAHA